LVRQGNASSNVVMQR